MTNKSDSNLSIKALKINKRKNIAASCVLATSLLFSLLWVAPSEAAKDEECNADRKVNEIDLSLFELEGSDPRMKNNSNLEFDPFEKRTVTEGGNGLRNEYKIVEKIRKPMSAMCEVFDATVETKFSKGAKTIVAQHHAGGEGAIVKLYLADTKINEPKNLDKGVDFDGKAKNGVFDVYFRLTLPEKYDEEITFYVGSIRNGEKFGFQIINAYGTVTAKAMGITKSYQVQDSKDSYFKFGTYPQAQYPNGDYADRDTWACENLKNCKGGDFYGENKLDTSIIKFSEIHHSRKQ